jgi:hypothetical protein
MFDRATSFNQNIGSWDVSSGTAFVSTEHSFGFQFNSIQYNTLLTGLNRLTNN